MAVGLITMDMYVPCSCYRRNRWSGEKGERQTRQISQSNSAASVMAHDQGGAVIPDDAFDAVAGTGS